MNGEQALSLGGDADKQASGTSMGSLWWLILEIFLEIRFLLQAHAWLKHGVSADGAVAVSHHWGVRMLVRNSTASCWLEADRRLNDLLCWRSTACAASHSAWTWTCSKGRGWRFCTSSVSSRQVLPTSSRVDTAVNAALRESL